MQVREEHNNCLFHITLNPPTHPPASRGLRTVAVGGQEREPWDTFSPEWAGLLVYSIHTVKLRCKCRIPTVFFHLRYLT